MLMNDQVTMILDAHGGIADVAARLSGPGRELHRAVLRRFLATGAAPTRRWLRQAAGELGTGGPAADELASSTWYTPRTASSRSRTRSPACRPPTASSSMAHRRCTRCAPWTRSACRP
jgi:hypothetical protein